MFPGCLSSTSAFGAPARVGLRAPIDLSIVEHRGIPVGLVQLAVDLLLPGGRGLAKDLIVLVLMFWILGIALFSHNRYLPTDG